MESLINFMSSKLTVRCTKRLMANSAPFCPLIGVLVSFKNRMVATYKTKSTKVFQTNAQVDEMTNKNRLNAPVELVEVESSLRFIAGRVGNASGLEVWRVQARRSDMSETPSPTEW